MWRKRCRRWACPAMHKAPPPESDGLFRQAPRPADKAERSCRARGTPRPQCAPWSTSAWTSVCGRVRHTPHRPTCIPAMRPAGARAVRRTRRRRSSWVAGRTGSVRAVEFDYCCCHAAFAFAEMGIESIMVNCNPETVSTDYDTADRLYFEPLTDEDVLELIETERANGTLLGVVVQYGGQTPL